MTTGVCTDSVACIPPRDAEELGVEVVPFPVLFGTRSYRDGVDMDPAEFFSRLAVEAEMPTTSAPSPAEVRPRVRDLARTEVVLDRIEYSHRSTEPGSFTEQSRQEHGG